jgi:hypothetical protein
VREVVAELSTPKFWLLSVALGLFLGIAASFITDALRRRIRRAKVAQSQAERQLAAGSRIGSLERSELLAWGLYLLQFVLGVAAIVYSNISGPTQSLCPFALFGLMAIGASTDQMYSAWKDGADLYTARDDFGGVVFGSAILSWLCYALFRI